MCPIKRRNPKTKVVQLKKPVNKIIKKPLTCGFFEIDDPNYEIDELFACY